MERPATQTGVKESNIEESRNWRRVGRHQIFFNRPFRKTPAMDRY